MSAMLKVQEKPQLSLKEAYDQLLAVIKESEEFEANLVKEFGSQEAAMNARDKWSTRPEAIRLQFDEEWDVIQLIYERVPVIFRGM